MSETMNIEKKSLLQAALKISFWDILVGFPAGVLIFMATVLFSTLFSVYASLPVFVPLLILVVVAFAVGILSGITRLRQGPATALAAGLIAAGILGYLWLVASPEDQFNALVIGPLGVLIVITICPVGGWLGAKIMRAL